MNLYEHPLMKRDEFLLLPDEYDHLSSKELSETIHRLVIEREVLTGEDMRAVLKAISVVHVKEGRSVAEAVANLLSVELRKKAQYVNSSLWHWSNILKALEKGMVVLMHNSEVILTCGCSEEYRQNFADVHYGLNQPLSIAFTLEENVLVGYENFLIWFFVEVLRTVKSGKNGLLNSLVTLFKKTREYPPPVTYDLQPIEGSIPGIEFLKHQFNPDISYGMGDQDTYWWLHVATGAYMGYQKVHPIQVGTVTYDLANAELKTRFKTPWWASEHTFQSRQPLRTFDMLRILKLFGVDPPTRFLREYARQNPTSPDLLGGAELACKKL